MRNVDIVDGQKYTTTNYVEISLCGGTVNEVRVMPRFSSSNNDAAAQWVSLFQRDSKTDYTRVYLDGYMSKDTKLKIVGFQKNVSSKTGQGSLSLMWFVSRNKGSLQNSWKKTTRFGAEKGFQTSLFALK